jgi:hypothetical protein
MPTSPSLPRLFDFTPDDLAANQRGMLTERQKHKLLDELRVGVVDQVATVITLPLMALLAVGYFVVVPPLGDTLGPLILVVIALTIGGIIAFGYVWWRLMCRLLRRGMENAAFDAWLRRRVRRYAESAALIERGAVYAKSGLITHESDGEHEYVMLDGEEWQSNVVVDEDARLWKITPNQTYTFYLVTGTDWIVAAEQEI